MRALDVDPKGKRKRKASFPYLWQAQHPLSGKNSVDIPAGGFYKAELHASDFWMYSAR